MSTDLLRQCQGYIKLGADGKEGIRYNLKTFTNLKQVVFLEEFRMQFTISGEHDEQSVAYGKRAYEKLYKMRCN